MSDRSENFVTVINNKKLNLNDDHDTELQMDHKPTAISLFSGMGGDSLGIQEAGFRVIAFNEIDNSAIESHKLNFPDSTLIINTSQKDNDCSEKQKSKKKKLQKDKTNIQLIPDNVFLTYKGKVDLVFAGHPCQGFSNGGKKLPDDPRNTLFREFARVCKLIQPKYIIGENVDGLLSRKTSDGNNYIDVIVKEFDDIGYDINYQVCHAVKYGIPQLRKRLVYVGIRKDLKKSYVFPEALNDGKNNLPDLKNIISFNMEGAIKIEEEDYDMSKLPTECIMKDLTNTQDEDKDNIHPYLRLKSKSRDVEYSGKIHHSLLSFSKRDSPIHCEIIDIRNPSKTIICTYDHQPRLFVPIQNSKGYFLRCLLPDELKQIQGFPADFKISGTKKDKIKQIGNAVPPPLIKQIVTNLLV